MKVEWNNCFLCLNELRKNIWEVKRSKKARHKNGESLVEKDYQIKTKILLQYLLQTKKTGSDKYSGVINNVMELLGSRAEGGIRFCEECESKLNAICKLHEQLEVVQMKLVNILKSVKVTVLQCSKPKGGVIGGKPEEENGDHVGLKLFEEWIKNQEEECRTGGENKNGELTQKLKRQRRILDTLYAFQDGVLESDRESVDIPRVFLERCTTNFRPQHGKEVEQASRVVVKSEAADPEPEEMQLVDWTLDDIINSPASPENDPLGETQIPQKKEIKRTRKRKKAPTIGVEIKEEEDVPRARRSSSFLARAKISLTNNAYKKPRRPKKIETTEDTEETVQRFTRIRVPAAFAPKPDSKTKNFYRSTGYYGCRICSFTSRRQFTFEHHLRTHELTAVTEGNANSSIYHCEKCENVTFLTEQHYQFHKAGHDGQISILCDFCNVMWDPATLVDHMKTHNLEKIFPCPNCSFCSSTREKYINHMLRCHDRSSALECDICRQAFSKKCHLLTHYLKVHQAIEKLVCGVDGCTKEFLDPYILLGHRKVHKNIHVCQYCQRSFQNSCVLKAHLRTHTGEKPYPCEQCPEAFATKSSLEKHQMSRHGAPKLKCEHCGLEYTCAGSLKAHMTVHDDSAGFPCEHENCGKKLGSRKLLALHMRSHSSERPFVCAECGKAFKYSHLLNRHAIIHQGEKKFQCHYCDKAFFHKRYLVQHLRIHTGEKPYACGVCGKAFNQQAALYQHRRVHAGALSVTKEEVN